MTMTTTSSSPLSSSSLKLRSRRRRQSSGSTMWKWYTNSSHVGVVVVMLATMILSALLAETTTATAVNAMDENSNCNNMNNNNDYYHSAQSHTDSNGQTFVTVPLIPHHVQKERRRRQQRHRGLVNLQDDEHDNDVPRRRQEAQQVGALYHGYGTHYVDLFCGTPPQRQTVIVDTGSGVTAFPCSGCKDCGYPDYHIDRYFVESESSTFEVLGCDECSRRGRCKGGDQCRIGMSYQEGSSWSAYEGRDKCYIGGFHNVALEQDDGGTSDLDPGHAPAFAFPLTFGCQDSITGLFKTQLADGIMGMEDDDSAFWHQMFANKKISTKGFALCFSRPEEARRDGTEAGALTLGGSDVRLHTSPMVYSSVKGTSSASRGGFFGVHIRKIYMRDGAGGTSALSSDPKAKVIALNKSENDLNVGGVIVDSGTTDTYWNARIKDVLRKAYAELAGRPFSHDKLKLTHDELLQLPTFLFQLSGDEGMNIKVAKENGGGDPNKISGLAGDLDPDHPYDVILAVPPTHYMEPEEGVYVNRIYDTEGGGSVLGANAMMNHDIMFDSDHGRIGWAESECDYNKLVTDGGFPDALDGPADSGGGGGSAQIETVPPATESPAEEEQKEEEQEDEKAVEDKDKDEPKDEDVQPPPPQQDEDTQSSEQKKDEPAQGSDVHDQSSPSDDIQQSMADQCSSLSCRGGIVAALVASFVICFCLFRCCGGSNRKSPAPSLYQHTPEFEMTNGNGSSYKDDSFVDEPIDGKGLGDPPAFRHDV